jgi:hypothetical protein
VDAELPRQQGTKEMTAPTANAAPVSSPSRADETFPQADETSPHSSRQRRCRWPCRCGATANLLSTCGVCGDDAPQWILQGCTSDCREDCGGATDPDRQAHGQSARAASLGRMPSAALRPSAAIAGMSMAAGVSARAASVFVLDTGILTTPHVLDTGILTTPHVFGNRATPTLEIVGNGQIVCSAGDSAGAKDRQGHGTHCAGTIGGTTSGVAKMLALHAFRGPLHGRPPEVNETDEDDGPGSLRDIGAVEQQANPPSFRGPLHGRPPEVNDFGNRAIPTLEIVGGGIHRGADIFKAVIRTATRHPIPRHPRCHVASIRRQAKRRPLSHPRRSLPQPLCCATAASRHTARTCLSRNDCFWSKVSNGRSRGLTIATRSLV